MSWILGRPTTYPQRWQVRAIKLTKDIKELNEIISKTQNQNEGKVAELTEQLTGTSLKYDIEKDMTQKNSDKIKELIENVKQLNLEKEKLNLEKERLNLEKERLDQNNIDLIW